MSPALMEAYLSAAGKISRLAMGDVNVAVAGGLRRPGRHGAELSHRGPAVRHARRHPDPAPVPGRRRVHLQASRASPATSRRCSAASPGEQLEVTIDGERVTLFDWDKEISNTTATAGRRRAFRSKPGLHTVGVTFLATNDLPATELNRPFQRTMNTPGSIPGFLFYPHVGQVTIEGPYNAKGAGRHRESRPQSSRAAAPAPPRARKTRCARTIVSTLAKRAFRRPIDGRRPGRR